MFNQSFRDSMLSGIVQSGHARMIMMSIISPSKNLSIYSYSRNKTRGSLLMIFSMAHINNTSLQQRLMLETTRIEITGIELMLISLLLLISTYSSTAIITSQIIQKQYIDLRIMILLSKISSQEHTIKTE